VTRTREERVRDVRAVLAAARRLASRADQIAPELAASTGLSLEGVRLALAEHLEQDAQDDELASLVARAGDAPEVHVILSANVFTGALRAVALARAAAPAVTVRPSRRDPWFARALVRELGLPAVRLAEELPPERLAAGEIHVYGRDATIAAVRAAARPGVRVVGHGAGMGVAWIGADDDLAVAAEALARDVVPFDQRGCLSPRVALVAGDAARASAFAAALDDRLAAWELRVPRGALSSDEDAARARWLETLAFAGEVHARPAHAVAVAPEGAPLTVPVPGRNVHIAPIADAASAAALLVPFAHAVVAVGANDPAAARLFAPRHARISPLGRMQRPPLDGPVDGRAGDAPPRA
jgi:Acyl-CoA reductase (LuxC)